MQKHYIDLLEDMLTNQEKYKKQLRFREMELEDTLKEIIPESQLNTDLQHPGTIRASSNTSSVESKVLKCHDDTQYQLLYSVVHNTPRFIRSMTKLEVIIYEYKYRDKDITVNQWEHVAALLDAEVRGKDRSIGKTTTLKIRNKMLQRYADYIGIPIV